MKWYFFAEQEGKPANLKQKRLDSIGHLMPEKFLTEDQTHQPLLLMSDSDSTAHVDYVYFYKEKGRTQF